MAKTDTGRKAVRPGRPEWIDEFMGDRLYWKLYDSRNDRIKFCRAHTQREAVIKALKLGIVPQSTNDIAPIAGGSRIEIMTEEELSELLNQLER